MALTLFHFLNWGLLDQEVMDRPRDGATRAMRYSTHGQLLFFPIVLAKMASQNIFCVGSYIVVWCCTTHRGWVTKFQYTKTGTSMYGTKKFP